MPYRSMRPPGSTPSLGTLQRAGGHASSHRHEPSRRADLRRGAIRASHLERSAFHKLEVAAPGGFPAGVQVVEDGQPPHERTEAIAVEVRVKRQVAPTKREVQPGAPEVRIRHGPLTPVSVSRKSMNDMLENSESRCRSAPWTSFERLALKLSQARRLFRVIASLPAGVGRAREDPCQSGTRVALPGSHR